MPPPKDPVKREEWLKNRRGENHPMFGKHRPEETRRKISVAQIGKPIPFETRQRMSAAHFGKKRKPFTEETLIRMSVAQTGRIISMEHRQHIGDSKRGEKSPWYGKHLPKETRLKISIANGGGNHGMWKGGISFEPYPITFNKAFKQFICDYYGNVCLNCGKTPEENGRKLTCHHYDYNKDSKNCVPTCTSCNSIANGSNGNGSRGFWEDWYIEILNEFYNGKNNNNI